MQQWCSRQIIQKEQISLNLKAWEMMEEFKWDGNWWHAYHQTYLQTSSWRNVILAHCPMQEWLIQKQKPDSEVTLPSGFNSSPNEEWVKESVLLPRGKTWMETDSSRPVMPDTVLTVWKQVFSPFQSPMYSQDLKTWHIVGTLFFEWTNEFCWGMWVVFIVQKVG